MEDACPEMSHTHPIAHFILLGALRLVSGCRGVQCPSGAYTAGHCFQGCSTYAVRNAPFVSSKFAQMQCAAMAFIMLFFFFILHFCKTNAQIRVLSLLFLIIWEDWARISHWKCFFLQCSINCRDTFLDFSSLPVHFKKDTRTARTFPRLTSAN